MLIVVSSVVDEELAERVRQISAPFEDLLRERLEGVVRRGGVFGLYPIIYAFSDDDEGSECAALKVVIVRRDAVDANGEPLLGLRIGVALRGDDLKTLGDDALVALLVQKLIVALQSARPQKLRRVDRGALLACLLPLRQGSEPLSSEQITG